MADISTLRSLEVDLGTNTLRLVIGESGEGDALRTSTESATIDIGASGRLIGVETADRYIDVMSPELGTEHLIRSTRAEIDVERVGERPVTLIVPRLGAGYEITYPSGNQ